MGQLPLLEMAFHLPLCRRPSLSCAYAASMVGLHVKLCSPKCIPVCPLYSVGNHRSAHGIDSRWALPRFAFEYWALLFICVLTGFYRQPTWSRLSEHSVNRQSKLRRSVNQRVAAWSVKFFKPNRRRPPQKPVHCHPLETSITELFFDPDSTNYSPSLYIHHA